MKVLIVKSDAVGGIEKHIKDLNYFLEKEGHQTETIKVKLDFKGGLKSIYSYIKMVDNFSPDIIHFHGFKATLYALYPFEKANKIVTVHNDLEHLQGKKKGFIARGFSQSVKGVDEIICVSKHLKEYIKPLAKKKKVKVIYNGISLPPLINKETTDAVNIGCCGRLTQIKGIHILVDAFIKLSKEHRNIYLHIIGDGPGKTTLQKQAQPVKDRVVFYGYLNSPYVKMSRFDIFVQPSLSEGFGITVLEAMALDIPVIASDAGGLKEIIMHNKNGLIVEKNNIDNLKDALQKLIQQKKQRERLRVNRGYVKNNFSLEAMYKETMQVYNQKKN
ncbi:glycosyltransferase family 4 protein [Proteinivorax tanatarense]|uniref:Glycosyltransferase family 4 protein n=1 Tax=Proteinivorax tanatarense TaxID=1260629 RepID=A0AAU7VKL2_9FIRM